ncbi:MAG TPA: ABC transporter permease subunit [Mobilitalea sp.]|nr:ABC transporter permease subunit [Mobilitalea sp.]
MAAFKKKLIKYMPLYIMLLPGFLYILVNNYIPMAGIIIAFKNLDFRKGILKSDWAGFSNFEFLFKSPDAFRITRNTILYNLVFILATMIFSVLVAILLSEIRSKKCIKLYQTVILLPFMISYVIVSYLAYAFLSSETGFLNGILKSLGLHTVSWYTEPKYWPAILIFINVWKGLGYSAIIYLASILGIDQELYEAAAIDGTGKLKQIIYITLPLIKPTIITMLLLQVGRIFYSDFGLFYQVPLNSGALMDVTNTIDTYVFRGLMTLGDISMSSAAGVYQSIVGFILVMLANWFTRKYSSENALF